jgi:hypothetical protein
MTATATGKQQKYGMKPLKGFQSGGLPKRKLKAFEDSYSRSKKPQLRSGERRKSKETELKMVAC